MQKFRLIFIPMFLCMIIILYIDMHPYAFTHREGEGETANSGSGSSGKSSGKSSKRNKSDPPVANEIKWVDPPVVNGINLDPPDEFTTLVGRQTRFVDACTPPVRSQPSKQPCLPGQNGRDG
jgi:hypothetical protein